MLHPIFSLLINRPELVVEHVAGYAALVHQEASSASSDVARRAAAWAIVILSGALFLGLAGAAVMLGFLMGQFHWALVAVPSFMLVMAGVAYGIAKKPFAPERFNEIKAQLQADMQTLRTVSEARNHGR
jgi:predicted lipid-binding transport protein (Tim44 family)